MGKRERRPLKKLEAAALHWLGVAKPPAKPLTVDDGVADGLRKLGVSAEDIAAAQEAAVEPEPDDFEVHEDAWDAWLFFLTVQRQWVFIPMTRSVGLGGVVVDAVRHGLNWPGIEAMARMSGTRRALWPDLFADLMVIECAVMKALAEAEKRQ